MDTPHYIKDYEQREGILSRNKVTMPEGFDEYLKDKKMSLVYSDSISDFETNKISFKSTNGKDSLNFYKNLKFIYEYENGSIVNGTWKCENGEMVVDTEDGYQFTSTKGWNKVNVIKQDDLNPNVDDDNEI